MCVNKLPSNELCSGIQREQSSLSKSCNIHAYSRVTLHVTTSFCYVLLARACCGMQWLSFALGMPRSCCGVKAFELLIPTNILFCRFFFQWFPKVAFFIHHTEQSNADSRYPGFTERSGLVWWEPRKERSLVKLRYQLPLVLSPAQSTWMRSSQGWGIPLWAQILAGSTQVGLLDGWLPSSQMLVWRALYDARAMFCLLRRKEKCPITAGSSHVPPHTSWCS